MNEAAASPHAARRCQRSTAALGRRARENVMVREDGIVKVLDFGIARRAGPAPDPSAPTAAHSLGALTGEGGIVGTAAYMPPEQMQGQELDGRALP